MDPRRWLLLTVTAIAVLLQHSSALSPRARPPQPQPVARFGFESVQRLAQQRAGEPYRDRSGKLPDSLGKTQLRRLSRHPVSRPSRRCGATRRCSKCSSSIAASPTTGASTSPKSAKTACCAPVNYNPSQFEFGKGAPPKDLPADLGFAGLRVHYPLQRPDYKDELIAFLGASYFRVLGRDQSYGASARGLAINVASTGGEEFPYFTDFWLVRPAPEQRTLTIYALLDSPEPRRCLSVRGATREPPAWSRSRRRYTPRQSVDKLGLAPMTSMYLVRRGPAAPIRRLPAGGA